MASFNFTIEQFLGIDHSQGITNVDPKVAAAARNINTRSGLLETAKGASRFILEDAPFPARRLFRFDKLLESGVIHTHWIVCTDNSVYAYDNFPPEAEPDEPEEPEEPIEPEETEEPAPSEFSGWVRLYDSAQSGLWSSVVWEENGITTLFLGNGLDDNMRWDGVAKKLQPWNGTPQKFRSLAVYKDRMWGAAIAAEPDNVYFSRAYQPENWKGNAVDLSDAGGSVVIHKWNGDPIVGILPTMDDLGVFRRGGMQRILNDDPQNFVVWPVNGTAGAVASNALTNSTAQTYFLSSNGIGVYDGVRTYVIDDRKLVDVYNRINHLQYGKSCSAIHEGTLYLSFAIDASDENNIVLAYDTMRQSYMLYDGVSVAAWGFDRENGQLLALINKADSAAVVRFGAGDTWDGEPINAYWTSPWLDFGRKRSMKFLKNISAYGILRRVDGSESSPALLLEVETELRRVTSKRVTGRDNVYQFFLDSVPVKGYRFRITIRNEKGSAFSLDGGIEITSDMEET